MFILAALYIERRLAVVSPYTNMMFFCVGLNFHLTCDAQFFVWDSSTSVSLFVDVITLFSYSTKKVDLIRRLSFCDLPCVLETGAFQLPKSSK